MEESDNNSDFNLIGIAYIFVITTSLLFSGVLYFFGNNKVSNKVYMIAVYALGILILNAIALTVMRNILRWITSTKKSEGACRLEDPEDIRFHYVFRAIQKFSKRNCKK